MRGEKHEGKGLKYLTVLPDEYDEAKRYPLVIMLHGFGANMQDLAGLAPVIHLVFSRQHQSGVRQAMRDNSGFSCIIRAFLR